MKRRKTRKKKREKEKRKLTLNRDALHKYKSSIEPILEYLLPSDISELFCA